MAGWLHSWQTAKVRHSYVQVADTVSVEPVQQAGLAPQPKTPQAADSEAAPTVAEPETVVEESVPAAPSRNRTVTGVHRAPEPVHRTIASTPAQPPIAPPVQPQPAPKPVETAAAHPAESPAPPAAQPSDEEERHPLKQRQPVEHVPERTETEQPHPQAEQAPPPQNQQQASVPSHPRDPIVRDRSPKMRAAIIAGSAAGGAIIGGIAGGGRGAAIGALTGAAGGYIYDRVTRHKYDRVNNNPNSTSPGTTTTYRDDPQQDGKFGTLTRMAGGTAAGAAIGGLVRGTKGAVVGAVTGAGGGYIYDRVRRRR
jgi:uncharacterized protein YcfJ